MRRIRALLGVLAAAAVLVGVTPTPAHAARTITATVPSGVGCPSGQVMTVAKFTLTGVSAGQQITVQTELSALTRNPNSFAAGRALYDVSLDARLQNPSGPGTATVPDNWSGTFQLTSAACKSPNPVSINAQGSICGTPPQVSVRLNNTNSIMVTYQVSGSSFSGQTKQVLGGRTEEVVFDNAERGKTYQVTANGDDGTRSTASVEVPACAPPTTAPPEPSARPTKSSPPPSASPSASPSESPTPDPFYEAEASTEPSASPTKVPKREKSNFASSPITWVGVSGVLLGVILLAGLGTAWLVRRRYP